MVVLKVLSGKRAGFICEARRFPVRVGRTPGCELQLEDHGVWNEHFQIELHPAAGFILQAHPDALVTANGQPVQHTPLRNGDLIEIGAAKLQFWLGDAAQRGLRSSEALVWALITAIAAAQGAIVLWLTR
jgi:pSer/pThr/pTyr-binding forkhead associated (FHA) protein